MKSIKLTIKGIVMAMMAAGAVACSSSEGGGSGGGGDEYNYTDLINTYVNDVVIPTYAEMKDGSWVLLEKVKAYNADQSPANLQAVCDAWIDVRAPWELSEAFLFGPCGDNGLNVDPNIDTWPFDEPALAQILGGSDALTVAAVSGYNETLRGYHTIEYLIFENGAAKTTQLNARQREYLVAAATVLNYDCIRVWAAWHGMAGISAKDLGAIEDMEEISYWDVAGYLDGSGDPTINQSSYSYYFKNAKGIYSNSQSEVVAEIIDGCREIASEVSEGKIQTPHDEGVEYVESRYAYNSLTDFTNNIIGIRNAYYGYRTDKVQGWTSATATIADGSLAAFVQESDEAMHNRIVAAMNNAIAKIGAIDYPFTTSYQTDHADIAAAVTACANVDAAFLAIKTLME